ncbi:hypothetical protein B0H19DRAFT_364178 [Mycena capillaripes]|nr:hypothetical protein B0H19DRAFT_364178 [Mycena capillaripes]
MLSALAIVAAVVASTSAIFITSPNPSEPWTNDGAQPISWTSVDTDPKNFTILLVNMKDSSLNQVLDALVPTDDDTTTVNPPATGWPAVGDGYRVNFVQDSEHLNSILAQSDQFSIKAAPPESSSSTSATQTLATTPTVQPTTTPATTTPTNSADVSASATDSASPPVGTNGALPTMGVHTGVVLLLSAVVLAQF